MKKPQILFFDLGDTIITNANNEPFNHQAGFQAVLDQAMENKSRVTAAELAADYLTDSKERRFDTPQGLIDLTMEVPFSTTLRFLLEKHNVTLPLSNVDAAELFWMNRNQYKACDGIQTLFRFLKEQKIRTAMITNNLFQDTIVKRRLDELLPDNGIEFIVSSADYALCKPNKRLFQLALQKAGVAAGDAWHAGDHVGCDVYGAGSVGIYPVWYKPYYSGHEVPEKDTSHFRAEHWQDVQNALS